MASTRPTTQATAGRSGRCRNACGATADARPAAPEAPGRGRAALLTPAGSPRYIHRTGCHRDELPHPFPAVLMLIGVFGGTFDPVHTGHLILAEQAREQARLDAVWFVPAPRPPHKDEEKIARFE